MSFPFSNVEWFFGIVEDVDDPEESGRVRVRCFGVHTENKEKNAFNGIPTDELIWAQVAGSPFDGRMENIGKGPHKLVNGTQVAGIFVDGKRAQVPVVLFVIGTSTPEEKPLPDKGFADPDGVYPKEPGRPHINELATKDFGSHPIQDTLSSETIEGEPPQTAAPVYPFNQVYESIAGHIVEVDDTPDNERVRLIHKTGSYVEMKADGSIVIKSVDDSYSLAKGDINLHAEGDVNVKAKGEAFLEGKSLATLEAALIKLGIDASSEPVILGMSFIEHYANHNHGTAVGPSSPPLNPPTPDLLSDKVFVE